MVMKLNIPALAFQLLARHTVWLENKELLSSFEEHSVWPSLGHIAVHDKDQKFGSKYLNIGRALAKIPEFRQHMEGELATWMRVFFSTDYTESMVIKYNGVLREVWRLNTGIYTFEEHMAEGFGLSLAALSQVWKDFDFTASGWLDKSALWLRSTILVMIRRDLLEHRVQFHVIKAFFLPLANVLMQTAAAVREMDLGRGSEDIHSGGSREALEIVSRILEDLGSQMKTLPDEQKDHRILRRQFNKDIAALRNLVVVQSLPLHSNHSSVTLAV
ncbi:hypothetical protein DFH09DRAFT_1503939 [Mycena vulgaris]|nr:hypothetical protein DFH09DRAFT_1503939 [Mycena vulgaris]